MNFDPLATTQPQRLLAVEVIIAIARALHLGKGTEVTIEVISQMVDAYINHTGQVPMTREGVHKALEAQLNKLRGVDAAVDAALDALKAKGNGG